MSRGESIYEDGFIIGRVLWGFCDLGIDKLSFLSYAP